MLNKEQQRAVDSKSRKILCLAGAGTGKTHTMIARISNLVDNVGISTARILVLTFTNAAAAEMEARYRVNHKGSLAPKFATFHSFCYSLIIERPEIRQKLGYTSVPSILSEEDRKFIDAQIRKPLNIKVGVKKLAGIGTLTREEQRQYELYWKTFKKEIIKRNLITFDIMCNDVCKLFEDDDTCIEPIKHRYSYIFVDEFQDTDPIQWKFVSSFPENTNIFIVGDVKQAIYAFRGADSSIIKSIAKDDLWEVVKLVHNYRSTKQICDYANTIGDHDPAYTLNLVSEKSGPDVMISHIEEVSQFDPECERSILAYIDHVSCDCDKLAILVRTNAEVSLVSQILKNHQIAFETKWTPTDSINILRCCISEETKLSWLASLLPGEDYNTYIQMKLIDDNFNFDMFLEVFGDRWYIKKRVNQIDEVCEIASDSSLFPYMKVSKILKYLDLPEVTIDFNKTDFESTIEYCISVADGMSSSPVTTKQSDLNIYVGTIHSSKGLEYDAVLLLGAETSSFRLTNEENLNLYYVGCTRAKKHLKIVKGL